MNADKRASHAERRWFAAVTTLAAAFLAAWPGPAVAADDGPYPIWWSPVLEFDSLDNVERRLDRRLWKDFDDVLELYRRVDGRRLTAVADSCRSLLKLSAEGFEARGRHERAIFFAFHAECRAIEMLGRAKPARRSFVRDFALDADALFSMPAPIDGPSCDFTCRQIHANDKGVPWSGFGPVNPVEKVDEFAINVPEDGWMREIRLVGRADVNGDGLDDIMIIADSWATKGRYTSTELFTLTQYSPGAVLKYLGPDHYRCDDYQCDPEYSMPVW
jgi:hypothetical protein